MLLGVSYAWWFYAILRIACPYAYATPNLQIGMVFEIDKGTRILTHYKSLNVHVQPRVNMSVRPKPCCPVEGSPRLYLPWVSHEHAPIGP